MKGSAIIDILVLSLMLASPGNNMSTESVTAAQEPVSESSVTSQQSVESSSTKVDDGQPYTITDQHFDIFDSYGDKEYDAFVEIENTSKDPLYLSDARFDIEDSNGHLMQTDNLISVAPDVVQPGEKGYLFYSLGSLDLNSTVNTDDAHLVPSFTAEKATDTPHSYPVSDLSTAPDEYGGVKLIGRMTNDTSEDTDCYAVVAYYDADGKCMGVAGTNVVMDAGQTTSFEISGMSLPHDFDTSAVADYKLYADEPYYQF